MEGHKNASSSTLYPLEQLHSNIATTILGHNQPHTSSICPNDLPCHESPLLFLPLPLLLCSVTTDPIQYTTATATTR